jgi:hypothetical protein
LPATEIPIFEETKTIGMTEQQMMELIDSWENLNFLMHEIANNTENIPVLAQIALYGKQPKSWRAAWLMDKIHEKEPLLIAPVIPEIIDQLKVEKSEGKKRHFLKLVSLNAIPENSLGFLTNFCIKVFTSSKEPIAVRVHAMQILYNIAVTEPGLKPEIRAIIEHEIENHPSAGLESRGRKLLKKLVKN